MKLSHVVSIVLLTFALAHGEPTHKDVGPRAAVWAGARHLFPLNFGPTGIVGWLYDQAFVVTAVDHHQVR